MHDKPAILKSIDLDPPPPLEVRRLLLEFRVIEEFNPEKLVGGDHQHEWG